MVTRKIKLLKGAASFYMVAFSTLLLVIVATSFAMAIVANIERTSNDDLSQSAYDAAMAGVEDAILAYKNYLACKASLNMDHGADYAECGDIIGLVESSNGDCLTVAKVLGKARIYDVDVEVPVGDSSMDQAYTCVKLRQSSDKFTLGLDEDSPQSTTVVEFADGGSPVNAAFLVLKWKAASSNGDESQRGNIIGKSVIGNNKVRFFPMDGEYDRDAVPVISLQVVQGSSENSSTLEAASLQGDELHTNRATAYFVPVENGVSNELGGVLANGLLGAEVFASTNSGRWGYSENQNQPFLVKCDPNDYDGDGFPCEVKVGLPKPLGGSRSKLSFAVASIYGNSAEVDVEILSEDGRPLEIKGGNAVVDSTGRAGDLYRRVQVRLQSQNTYSSGITSAVLLHENAKIEKSNDAPMDGI